MNVGAKAQCLLFQEFHVTGTFSCSNLHGRTNSATEITEDGVQLPEWRVVSLNLCDDSAAAGVAVVTASTLVCVCDSAAANSALVCVTVRLLTVHFSV